MPTISMFYGILIMMFHEHHAKHHTPHIHAKFQNFQASISIDEGEILAGDLPRKQLRLVQAWIELNRDSLMANWELAINHETLFKIEPLH